jgi:hypothetical protein
MYLHFLQNDLPLLLEELDLNTRERMWFQQDGAPPHFHRNVRQHLDDNFTNIWIGRGSNNLWPPRSPDLTPLDFFLVGLIKRKSLPNICAYNYNSSIEELKEFVMSAWP